MLNTAMPKSKKKPMGKAGAEKRLSGLEGKLNNFALNSQAKWEGLGGMVLAVFIMSLVTFVYVLEAPWEWKLGFSVFWIAFFVLAGLVRKRTYKRLVAAKKRKEELKRLFSPIKKAI